MCAGMTRTLLRTGVVSWMLALSTIAAAADSNVKPFITRVAVSNDQTLLTIEGGAFVAKPSGWLADFEVAGVQVDTTGRQITASLPTLRPGTYLIKVGTKNQEAIFAVAVVEPPPSAATPVV